MLSGQIKSDSVRREISRERMLNDNPMHNPKFVKKVQESRKWYMPSQETKRKTSETMKGVKKSKSHCDNIGKSKSKTYIITHPCGKEQKVTNLSEFCRNYKLTDALMYKVASGKRNHHRGFLCSKS